MVLSIQNLSVSYGNKLAVKQISFHVLPGQVIGLLGANGAGKSSTIAAVLGIEKSTYDRLEMLGKSPVHNRKEVFQKVGVQFQETNFQDNLTVRDACKQWQSLYKETAHIPTLLQTFGLVGKEQQLSNRCQVDDEAILSSGKAVLEEAYLHFAGEAEDWL